MQSADIENKYKDKIMRHGSVLLLLAEDALRLLDDCMKADLQFLGIEAFRLFEDGGIQPSMEFSNISFGTADKDKNVKFERNLRSPWNKDSKAIENSKQLIHEGAKAGFKWFEISLKDTNTNQLLFFRL